MAAAGSHRAGPVALMGGNEFRRESEAVDAALLALAGGPGAAVGIVPTAATNENPEVVGENGLRHLTRLGATPETLLIVDDASAGDPSLAAALAAQALVYLTGGDPAYLLETLQGSAAWDAVLAVHAQGGVVAGSGAGAMVLGASMWHLAGWVPGLALAPGLAVLPHHATLSKRWSVPHMLAALPAGITLVGIDESTALLLPEGRVVGAGAVTVYGPHGPKAYPAGQHVPIRLLLG